MSAPSGGNAAPAGGTYSANPPSAGPAPGPAPGAPANASANPPSAQNLNQIVTDYLLKKGFNRTEAIFRQEISNMGPDGRPRGNIYNEYLKAFNLLKDWVENHLDIYKFELAKVLWPVFVYSYLRLVQERRIDEARKLFDVAKPYFERTHADDLKTFNLVSTPEHVKENSIANLYLHPKNEKGEDVKYRIPLNQYAHGTLIPFLESEHDKGGGLVINILTSYCQLDVVSRGPIQPYSFESIYRRAQNLDLDEADAQEGIPGVFTGVTNRDALDTSIPLKLGPLPMEPELRDDVRAELEEEDRTNPPPDGRSTLIDEFDRKIKREDSADVPNRADLPLPPSRGRDVVMEMQKVRENRDRFKIEGRTDGVGVGVSVCMFTFHNSLGNVSCMEFSKDQSLIAVGTMDSYIRVYTVDGSPLKSKMAGEKDLKVNNRKLVGHSGPIYGLSFSDATSGLDRNPFGEGEPVGTSPQLLLSSSADGHVRLWSLDVWACLCVYKAHDGPVFRCLWGPHGHYFLTGGWDKTVRVFMQDHASAQRILVGHDTSISAIAWHPNGTYVFSASDESDKSIRMWSVITGACVRVFTGHVDYISTLECAPNGKILASADNGGNIIFWDINNGQRIKRCRGHGKGGIPSMSFSAESNVLVSGGLDGTVRIWDVELPADGNKTAVSGAQQPQVQDGVVGDSIIATGGQTDATRINGSTGQTTQSSGAAASGGGSGGTGKKKGKEVMVTPDQISAFPTKKTPVRKVQFTRMNLVVAGGCFDPER